MSVAKKGVEVYLVFVRDDSWEYTLKQIFRNKQDAIDLVERGGEDTWHYEPWSIK